MSKQKKATASKVLKMKGKEYITPHYIRVTLTGDVADFANTTLGDNNKIFIPPKGVQKVYLPQIDSETKLWIHPPTAVAPYVRTYTHMGIDLEKRNLQLILSIMVKKDQHHLGCLTLKLATSLGWQCVPNIKNCTPTPQIGSFLLEI